MVIALLATSGIICAAPASSVTPTWSVVPSASPPGPASGYLTTVACATDTRCFAIGNTVAAPFLIEQWDGAHWSIAPLPVNSPGAQLNDIACASPTACFAVGLSNNQAFVEQWDGSTWSVATTPVVSDAALWSVACGSATSCVAVGRVASHVLVEQWDGSTWSVAATPQPPKGSAYFVGAGCANASNCFAVGVQYDGQNPPRPFVERWNGSVWSIVSSPTPPKSTVWSLNAVSCASNTSCFAVGGTGATSLIEHWNGTNWSVVPGMSGNNGLADVACPAPTSCFAVGSVGHATNGPGHNFIEHWNGTKWSAVANPNADPNLSGLSGVACRSSVLCFAIGGTATIVRLSGTSWTIQAHPMPMPSASELSAVSCAGAAPCFAVGSLLMKSGAAHALVERRTASGWVVVASPVPAGAVQSVLSGVSCLSTSFCMAVGGFSTKTANKSLVERWNGTKWSVVPSPNAGNNVPGLAAVSCTTTKRCFAVGGVVTGGVRQTLVERWNGSKWSIVPSPNRPSSSPSAPRANTLSSVSCTSAANCMAVGQDEVHPGTLGSKSHTLVERWNGSAWSIVPSPNPSPAHNSLAGVSCVSMGNCFAVGVFINAAPYNGQQSLIEHWNGSAWRRVASPESASLAGVSCPTATSCVAVGSDYTGGEESIIVKTRTSAGWSTAVLPPPGDLNAISCSNPSKCFAVGEIYQGNSTSSTLVEQFS